MTEHSRPPRLDYKASERVACERFRVEAIMGQDGLSEIADRATPAEWARFYIENFNRMDPVFLSSAMDAMLTQLSATDEREGLDVIISALQLAQAEPWACSILDIHMQHPENAGEVFVADLIKNVVDVRAVQTHAQELRRPFDKGM